MWIRLQSFTIFIIHCIECLLSAPPFISESKTSRNTNVVLPMPSSSPPSVVNIRQAGGLSGSRSTHHRAVTMSSISQLVDNLQPVKDSQRQRRRRRVKRQTTSSTNCQDRLTGQIEGCLIGYEKILLSSGASSRDNIYQLRRTDSGQTVLRHLCR